LYNDVELRLNAVDDEYCDVDGDDVDDDGDDVDDVAKPIKQKRRKTLRYCLLRFNGSPKLA